MCLVIVLGLWTASTVIFRCLFVSMVCVYSSAPSPDRTAPCNNRRLFVSVFLECHLSVVVDETTWTLSEMNECTLSGRTHDTHQREDLVYGCLLLLLCIHINNMPLGTTHRPQYVKYTLVCSTACVHTWFYYQQTTAYRATTIRDEVLKGGRGRT